MKGPTRPAPSVPGIVVNRYSPVTNWDNDPFGADVFEPSPHYTQKKKPPPRPPPPKVGRQPDVPAKPSHFNRRPTVLSSLLSRYRTTGANQNVNTTQQSIITDFNSDVDTHKMFPKCEPKNVQTGALIDLSSPPSSPTFTTRSSSDGLSVDSFGSDATTSTNHHNAHNGGNASQAESGFEDDFDLFLHSRKPVNKEDTLDDFTSIDPFSPQPVVNKPSLMKKPVLSKDLYDASSNFASQPAVPLLKGPTIIRAKPSRPKPPDNAAILKNTFGSSFPVTPVMTVNTTTPIQKITNGFGDSFESKPLSWDEDERDRELSPERDSPPMPTIPPPPPPADVEDDVTSVWPAEEPDLANGDDEEEPYAIALFDYFTDHSDDLCFSANSKIKLIRRVDHEWLYGSLRNGAQGLFPSNYVEIKVPLPNEPAPPLPLIGTAVAMYDFVPDQPGDLPFNTGDTILVRYKINDEWYFGECNGAKGQFPINYVQMS
ncbi:SH3 domain-containing lethal (3) 05822 isoform X2 [Anticarsia gemmatalis]